VNTPGFFGTEGWNIMTTTDPTKSTGARTDRHERQRQRLIDGARQQPCRIVIGASGHFDPGWIPTDIHLLNLLQPDQWTEYLGDASVDAFLAEHVWEHLSPEDGATAARTCHRFLRPGGYLRVAVPDGFHPDPAYIDWVKPNGIGPGCDDHRVLYTYQTFAPVFEAAGFEVRLLEHFDSTGQFHFNEWNPADGKIERSSRFDERNSKQELKYTSLMLDAIKR
jgi:predicted SAM-dependent methyltransferase